MLTRSVSRAHQSAFTRLLPLFIVSLVGVARMAEMPAFLYADPGDDYDNGWWMGYGDGYDDNPEADLTGQTAEYQSGYSDGYGMGVADREMEYDPAAEYEDGWWMGYGDGYDGLPQADMTGQSGDYQAGYQEGYDMGVADAEMEAGMPE